MLSLCHAEGVRLQKIKDSGRRLQKSAELRQDQFLNLFGRKTTVACRVFRSTLGQSLRDIVSIASALLRSVRRSKSIPNLVVKQTCEKAGTGCSRPSPLGLNIGFELEFRFIFTNRSTRVDIRPE